MRDFSFENLLISYRTRLGWTTRKTADALEVSLRTYQYWESGERMPAQRWLIRIASLFQLTETEADELYRAAAHVGPEKENLPFHQNPFFTGREAYLGQLDYHLKKNHNVALTQPISISGLGGIGKTQLALEYAYRNHPKTYRTILWVNAADRSTLEEGYLSAAQLLELPEKEEREIGRIVQAVQSWLKEHTRWLLILDNADDLQLVRSFLPTKHQGHILLTTRSQIVGNLAVPIELEAMEPEEALLFLLRRSGVLKDEAKLESLPSAIRESAEQLVALLERHPLALDQAGAYIEEAGTSFDAYEHLYKEQRLTLLNKRGVLEGEGREHPETVVVTFEISFRQARELYPPAADVLSFCSFLQPDAIPEEVFYQDAGIKLDRFSFDKAIAALRRYSLIKRNAQEQVLSLHRLVQAVLVDAMSQEQRLQWMGRVVQAVNGAFPKVIFEEWTRCGRLLPHVQVCATWGEHEALPTAAAYVFYKAGVYLRERAQYAEAESLLLRANSMLEQRLGGEHPDTAKSMNDLALVYKFRDNYEQAELLHKRVLLIREQQLGPEHPDTAESLHNLACVYFYQGRYEEAEPVYERAVAIYEQHIGTEHDIDRAKSMHDLAGVYLSQGKFEQGVPLYEQAVSLLEQQLGPEHPDLVLGFTNLVEVYRTVGKYEQAEAIGQRALALSEQYLGASHHHTAKCLNQLAFLYTELGRYEQVEPLFQQALSILEQYLGVEHHETAESVYGLAKLYQNQRRYEQSEVQYLRALGTLERGLGPTHPHTQEVRDAYTALLQQLGRDPETSVSESAAEDGN